MRWQISGRVLWVRVGALVALVGGYVAYVLANNAEALAIEDAGGDAGLWGVGIVFVTATLVPGALLLVLSILLTSRSGLSAGLAAAAGVALLVPTMRQAGYLYPPDKRTDEGSALDPSQWHHVADLYLAALLLLGAAGALVLVSALAGMSRRTPVGASQPTATQPGRQSPDTTNA